MQTLHLQWMLGFYCSDPVFLGFAPGCRVQNSQGFLVHIERRCLCPKLFPNLRCRNSSRPMPEGRKRDSLRPRPVFCHEEPSFAFSVEHVDMYIHILYNYVYIQCIYIYIYASVPATPPSPPNGLGTPLPAMVGVCCEEGGTRCSKCIEMYRVSIDCIWSVYRMYIGCA